MGQSKERATRPTEHRTSEGHPLPQPSHARGSATCTRPRVLGDSITPATASAAPLQGWAVPPSSVWFLSLTVPT